MLKALDNLILNPKRLFLIDGMGAMVTAICLLLLGTFFREYFKMPQQVLFILAGIACMFSIYSITCFVFVTSGWRTFLKIISIANALYCCLTGMLLVYYSQELGILDYLYFIIEMLIVIALVIAERKAISSSS